MRKAILMAAAVMMLASPVMADETEAEWMSRDVGSDLFDLAHLMHGEAENTDSAERRKTGSVLLNRVDSPKFPDTIEENLYLPGQYPTVGDRGPFWGEPSEECWQDAEDLLRQWYETEDTDLPEDVLYQSTFPQGCGIYEVSEWGQYFCYG